MKVGQVIYRFNNGNGLADKPPTWLQVMHERLKHLIISSETFKKKKRAEHIAQARGKKHQKGKGYGKGKFGATTTRHLSTRCKLTSNSAIGIKDKLLCSV